MRFTESKIEFQMRATSRVRVPAVASLVVVASTLVASCSIDNDPGADHSPASRATSSVTTHPAEEPHVTRVLEYESLDQLEANSTLIVVGEPSAVNRMNPYYGDRTTPFGIADFHVREVLKGAAGSTVELSLEAGFNDAGEIYSDKLAIGSTYLLYLTPQGEKSPETYTIVGYKAGIFQEESRGGRRGVGADTTFTRVDDLSPELPASVQIKDVESTL